MATDRFMDLLRGVMVRTIERKVRWQVSEGEHTDEAERYVLALGRGKILVHTWVDDDRDRWFGAYLEDGQGRTVDETEAYRGEEKVFLQEVYTTARASALQVDDLIDTMLQDLESDKQQE